MQISLFLTLSLAVTATMTAPAQYELHEPEMTFAQFKAAFGKAYATVEEDAMRAAIFAAHLVQIAKHNADPTQTYKLGVNQFADLTRYRSAFVVF